MEQENTPVKARMPPPKYKCQSCEKSSFKSQLALKDHENALHSCFCPLCQRKFRSSESLIQHVSSKHLKNLVSKAKPRRTLQTLLSTPATTSCTKCNKKFNSIDSLIQHVKYKDHTKQKVNAGSSSSITTDDMIQTAAPQTPQLDIDTPQEPHPIKSTPATSKGTTEKTPAITESNPIPQLLTILDSLEQDLLFRYLLARCHPVPLLRAQGYNFPAKDSKPNTSKCLYSGTPHAAHAYLSTALPPQSKIRKAIALSTRITRTNDFDVIDSMAILDFLTGEVLYNGTLQQKSIQNKHLDATEDGIRWARNILIQYVDENTIVTGYRLHEDLNILELKVAPTRVVDVAIVTSEAVFKPIGMDRSLDWIWWVLAHEMLGWDESMIDQESSLWNALAVREILVWCLRGPECLSVWADGARAECLEGDKLWDEWEETEGEVGGFDYVGRDSLMD